MVVVPLYKSDPEEPFTVQIFQNFSTDFFAIAEALVIYLIKNASGQVRESFTQILHGPDRNFDFEN